MISFSLSFPSLTFLSLRSLRAVPNSFYMLHFFSILLPLFLGLLMQPPSQLPSSSSPFNLHVLGLSSLCKFFISHSFHMTGLCQPTPHQFLLKTFLHFNFHSQFIHSSVISSVNSHDSSFQVVFANLDLLLFLCLCDRI